MESLYTQQRTNVLPRLPYKGSLDLTYRCNNACRHCWLRLPAHANEVEHELSTQEMIRIVNEARAMGCREWALSGGEPMLRPDFPEIFACITSKARTYSLNTNGTLITPETARLLIRKGNKMVALYGATAKTYDHVTRHPGGFEKVMQGFRYLQEAGASFTVQLIPMRDNWQEWDQMIELAKSLSPHWRVGAPWLYLTSCQDPERNAEIMRQRLDPRDVVDLDQPDMSQDHASAQEFEHVPGDDRLFARCIAGRREFHIDPYGGMTFCSFLKDPAMRTSLRRISFQEAWDTFIPSLADKVHGGQEYEKTCGVCEQRHNCRWCPVYGWLEHGRYSAPVEHLCKVAEVNQQYKDEWRTQHRRYYQIAGITLQVDSDLPITDTTFHPKFESFRAEGPGTDTVTISHHFTMPILDGKDLGKELYHKPPWAISRLGNSYIYRGISPWADDPALHRVVTVNAAHTRSRIYNNREDVWRQGNLHSLTLFPSDQILIARLLADRKGCFLHSAGAILNGAGVLFVGHSEAGKSTTTKILMAAGERGEMEVEILCDDRNIVRLGEDGWRVYGTWSHGEIPLVSSANAPLRAICFIEKAEENSLTPLTDRKEVTKCLLACLIKPFVTPDWWSKTLTIIEDLLNNVPFYVMRFDKSGEIVNSLKDLGERTIV